MVDLSSSYSKAVKDALAKEAGVAKWEDYFTKLAEPDVSALTTQYQQAQEAVDISTQYDISQAYANYKKQQLSLAQAQQLGTGLKETIASGFGQQFQSQVATAEAEETQALSELQTSYLENLAEVQSKYAELREDAEKNIAAYGEKLNAIEQAVYEYAGVSDFASLRTPLEQGGLGIYKETEPGHFELTEEGRAWFDQQFHSISESGQLFSDYLREIEGEEGYEGLYDFYTQNKPDINRYVGGLDVSDTKTTPEESANTYAKLGDLSNGKMTKIDDNTYLINGETYKAHTDKRVKDAFLLEKAEDLPSGKGERGYNVAVVTYKGKNYVLVNVTGIPRVFEATKE